MQPLSLAVVIANREMAGEVQACLRLLAARVVMELPGIGEWAAFLDKLERMRPDVVLLELGAVRDSMDDAIRTIRRSPVAPVVVALHSAMEPEMILRTVRAGAAEYLFPPFASGLQAALERIAAERITQRGQRRRGKAIAFFSAKGGCGATTIACHVALGVQRHTKGQVLLADFDLDSGMVGFLLKSKSEYTVFDALKNVHRLDLSFWKALISNGHPGVEVIAAPCSAGSRQSPDDYQRIRQVLRFVRDHYDWILADLGRGLGANVMSALEEVDDACLVTTVDLPALHRAKHIIRTLKESGFKPERLHVILNRVPKRTDVTRPEVEDLLGGAIKDVIPDDHAALYECYAEGKLLPANSNLGKRFDRLSAGLAGAGAGEGKKKFSIFR